MRPGTPVLAVLAGALLAACGNRQPPVAEKPKPKPVAYFQVDAATAGTIDGRIVFHGVRPKPKPIDMNSDSGCPRQGVEETVVTGKGGALPPPSFTFRAAWKGSALNRRNSP